MITEPTSQKLDLKNLTTGRSVHNILTVIMVFFVKASNSQECISNILYILTLAQQICAMRTNTLSEWR